MQNKEHFRFTKSQIAARLVRSPMGNTDSVDSWRPVLAGLADDQVIDFDAVINHSELETRGVFWALSARPKTEIVPLIVRFLEAGNPCEYSAAAISLLERLHRGALHPHEQQTDFHSLATQAEAAARRMGERAETPDWRRSPLRAIEAAMSLDLHRVAYFCAESRVPLEIRGEGPGRINAFRQAWTAEILRTWLDSDFIAPKSYSVPRPAPAGPSAAQVEAVHMEIRRRKLANLSDEALAALLENDAKLREV